MPTTSPRWNTTKGGYFPPPQSLPTIPLYSISSRTMQQHLPQVHLSTHSNRTMQQHLPQVHLSTHSNRNMQQHLPLDHLPTHSSGAMLQLLPSLLPQSLPLLPLSMDKSGRCCTPCAPSFCPAKIYIFRALFYISNMDIYLLVSNSNNSNSCIQYNDNISKNSTYIHGIYMKSLFSRDTLHSRPSKLKSWAPQKSPLCQLVLRLTAPPPPQTVWPASQQHCSPNTNQSKANYNTM